MIYDHSQSYFENLMIGDHFADHHYGYIESKIFISMCQFFENLLNYMILPQIFLFPRKNNFDMGKN